MKELHQEEAEASVIPLGVRKNISQQKFRIPFKNMSLTHDADFDFTFVKTSPTAPDVEIDDLEDLSSFFEFYCQPGNMKIASNSQ